MSSAEVFDVIEQRLGAEWTTTPKVFENDEFEAPNEPAPFIFVEIFGDFFDQASIGGGEGVDANLWRETGQLLMHVMTPNGTGSRDARVAAKALIDLFRGQEIGGVEFRDASIGAGEPGRVFANYYAMTASVSWQRDQ